MQLKKILSGFEKTCAQLEKLMAHNDIAIQDAKEIIANAERNKNALQAENIHANQVLNNVRAIMGQ